MDSQLVAFVQNAYEKAQENGLTSDFPVTLLYGTDQVPRIIFVGYAEPVDYVLPINVIWVNVNQSSADFMKALRRVSKDTSITYEHTWTTLTEFDQVTNYDQMYDTADVLRSTAQQDLKYAREKTDGLPNQLRKSGDTATGALNARTLTTGQQYGNNELVPRLFVTQQISSQTNGFYGIILPMNTRLINVEQQANNLNTRVNALEQGTPVGLSPFVFTITEENNALSLNIQHQKNTMNISVTVMTREGDEQTPLYAQVGVHNIVAYNVNYVLVETLTLLPVGSRIIVYPAAA